MTDAHWHYTSSSFRPSAKATKVTSLAPQIVNYRLCLHISFAPQNCASLPESASPETHKMQKSPTIAFYRYLLLLTLLITCQSLLLLVTPAGMVEGDHPRDHPRSINATARSLADGLLAPSSLATVSRQLHWMVVASHTSLLSTRLRQLQWWWM